MLKLITCAIALVWSVVALAAEQTAPACAGPEFRQLDFWVGEWNLTWDGGKGTNVVTREMDGCVIHEHFSSDASQQFLRGESVSSYQPKLGIWRQTWVDNQGGYIPLTGELKKDGTFVLTTTRLNEKQRQTRMIFENIKPASFTWRWQSTADDGEAWKDEWVIAYARKK